MSVSIGTNDIYTNYTTQVSAEPVQANAADAKKPVKATEPEATEAAVYEKSEEPKKATYSINKMSEEDRAALVEQLKQAQQDRINQLSELVRKMFNQQADNANITNLADLFSEENLKKVSPEEIEQAKKDVAEDGYWGVKQTSQRLFDFASALAGDDVEKMKEMQAAMEKGYKQATKAWGKDLPDLCKDTLNAANQLFEDYYKSKEVTE